jgi:two-component system, NtrC family, sensor kinase
MTLRNRLILSFIVIAAFTGIFSVLLGPRLIYQTSLILLTLLLTGAVSYSVLHSFLKPIKELTAAIEEIATGPMLREIKIGNAPPEVQDVVNAFNRMQETIRERRRLNQEKLMHSDRLAVLGQLAAGVAHEINNPLGSILLFTRLTLQQTAGDGQVRDNLERIELETRRCHAIVQSLLDFARQREPKVEPVDVNELADAAISFFENQNLLKNIQIVRNYSGNLQRIQADQQQLQQVLINIIVNASDAMNGKGVLTIGTSDSEADESVRISITDTGCGIPPENLDRIFDPFFTTKDVGRGTGLGLSVSYGIVQAHKGDIAVSSTPGAGSRFTITLPQKTGSA